MDAAVTDGVATLPLDWRVFDDAPPLVAGEVQLVARDIDDDRAVETDQTLLNDAEAARAARLKIDRHRRRWIAGRVLLKRLLGHYAGVDATDIRLGYGDIGKPYLKFPEATGIQFNYTDSGGCLIYAFSRNIEVGIDLEALPRGVRYALIAPRKMTKTEQRAFEQIPEHLKEYAFLACWTRKESYGKALGVGIRYPMNEVTLCEDYSNAIHAINDEANGCHTLMQIKPPFDGIACLTVKSEFVCVNAFEI